jgi:hypothetical protein
MRPDPSLWGGSKDKVWLQPTDCPFEEEAGIEPAF